jgi:hypothetical protein
MTAVVILAVGVAVVVCAPIVASIRRGVFDPFEPTLLFALAWGAMFVVRPLAIARRDDTNFYGLDIGGTLDSAVLLGFVGACGFVCGYSLRVGQRVGRGLGRPRELDARSVVARAWIVAAIAGVAVAILLRTAGADGLRVFLRGRSPELDEIIAGSSVYAWWGSQLVAPAALATFAVAWVARSRVAIVSTIVLMLLVCVRAIPTGNRIVVLVTVGAVVVFVYLMADRRPGLPAFVVLLVLACVTSATLLAFRYPETRSNAGAALESLSPVVALRPITRGPDGEMAPALAGALTVVPSELGFRYGRVTFGELPLRVVPRVWWASKPETPQSTLVRTAWPEADKYGFSPALTPLLPFFWDFGLLGVFAGMVAYGIVARAAWAWLLGAGASVGARMVYAIFLFFLVVALRTDPVMTVVQFILFVVSAAVIFRAVPGVRGSAPHAATPSSDGGGGS